MSDFVDDAAGDRVEGFFLLRSHGAQAEAHPRDFVGADALQLFLEADDGRCDLARFQSLHHSLDFLADDLLGFDGRLVAAFDVRLHRLIQVVDVVEKDVVQVVDCRLDVARHGDIDQKNRAVLPAGDDGTHLIAGEDVMRRAAGSQQNIHIGQSVD